MHFDPTTLGWALGAGIAFFAISLLIGDIADLGGGDGGVDIGGGHDVSMGGDVHHGVTTSEILTIRNFGLLIIGFSGVSILAIRNGQGPLVTNIAGIAGGCLLVAFGIWLFRLVRGQESNSISNSAKLIGKRGVVLTSIPIDGLGEVATYDEFGASTTLNAQSEDGAMQAGAEVEITAVAQNVATVKPAPASA